MPAREIVVIEASSGGIEALSAVMRGLPAELPAALFVVQHIVADAINYLLQIMIFSGDSFFARLQLPGQRFE